MAMHSNELKRSAVIYAELEGNINSILCITCSKAASFIKKCVEIAGCVQYQYQPKIPIQEHHHTASVAMGLLASKED